MEEAFKTDGLTASFKLNAVSMTMKKMDKSSDLGYLALRGKEFVTNEIDEYTILLMPTDALGSLITRSKLHLCHDYPVAHYEKEVGNESGPSYLTIDGENWFLDPNEVFVHADQFQFKSGVFEDSPEAFLTASKGRVSIQFICKPEGLKLYRLLYFHTD
jgi:hypothetical protein